MRFAFLVALMLTGGALMGTAAQLLVAPQAQNAAGAPGQEVHWAKIKFDISDLNPLKFIYDEVTKQVTADANSPSFAVGTPVTADFSKMDAQIKLNNDKFQRMSGSGDISQMPESDPR